jgi:hypothetical protein
MHFKLLFLLKSLQLIVYWQLQSIKPNRLPMAKRNKNVMRLQSLIALLITMLLSGCGLFFGGNGQNDEDFAQYVERVFKLQNGLSSQLIALTDEDDKPANFDALLQAEQNMRKQCEALNQYATLDSEGASASLALKAQVAQSAKSCEASAKQLQILMLKNKTPTKK